MALKNCVECGKAVSDQAMFCPHCGYVLKKNGKGFGVVSLILGIFACIFTVGYCIVVLEGSIILSGPMIYVMLFSSLSTTFSLLSLKRNKSNNTAVSGLILGITAISFSLLCTIKLFV